MTVQQQIIYIYFWPLILTNFFISDRMQAQFRNNDNIYINDNSVIFIDADNYEFGLGTIATSRTKVDYGVLSFAHGASWKGADDEHFVDGYAKTESNSAFILPIGQSGIYAPIQVIPSNSEGVNAAYFRSPPNSIGSTLDELISSISSVEYWNIESVGVNTAVSLSYRPSSAISELTSFSLPNLTIVGWNGKVWVAIPSAIDEYSILRKTSSLEYGSISSFTAVDLSLYSAFSLGTITKEIQVDLIAYANKNRLFIDASMPITKLTIYDMWGKRVFSEQLNGHLKHEQAFNYPDEIYLVKIELLNGKYIIIKKIINTN
jgi:hypothetical protein